MPDVVLLIEAGKRIRFTLRIGSAEIGADEPVAIHRVERKFIWIDQERHPQTEQDKDDCRQEHHVPGV